MVSSVLDTASTITPTAIVFRILALIAIILDVFPLIWHTRAKNLPCASLIAYLMLDNSMSFINSIIWPTDDINSWWSGHGLCDLEIRLMIGTWIGVVACLTCMLRDLAAVLNTNNTVLALDPNQRLKRLLIDCGLCYGFPIYSIIAHYFVQGNRYYILSITGCNAGFDPSWLKVVLVFMWPPALVLVNTYYAGTCPYSPPLKYRYLTKQQAPSYGGFTVISAILASSSPPPAAVSPRTASFASSAWL